MAAFGHSHTKPTICFGTVSLPQFCFANSQWSAANLLKVLHDGYMSLRPWLLDLKQKMSPRDHARVAKTKMSGKNRMVKHTICKRTGRKQVQPDCILDFFLEPVDTNIDKVSVFANLRVIKINRSCLLRTGAGGMKASAHYPAKFGRFIAKKHSALMDSLQQTKARLMVLMELFCATATHIHMA